MVNEIALREVYPVDPTGGRLVAWAQAANAANGLAKALFDTDFVPESIKKEGDATAAILMGDELGLSPIAALRSIYVIKGTPALYARTMVALALSHGHEIWTVTSTDESVEVNGRRAGSDHIEKSVWTMARAAKAGYTANPSKKYQTNPQEMLYAKAASEIARKVAADILLGVPYSVEEMELETSNVVELERKPRGKLTVARADKTSPEVPEPEFDEPENSVAVKESAPARDDYKGGDVPWDSAESATRDDLKDAGANFGSGVGDVISDKQVGKIGAMMTELGMTDRAVAIAYVSDVAGREVKSRKLLTKFEGSRVIDALQHDIDQRNLAAEAGDE